MAIQITKQTTATPVQPLSVDVDSDRKVGGNVSGNVGGKKAQAGAVVGEQKNQATQGAQGAIEAKSAAPLTVKDEVSGLPLRFMSQASTIALDLPPAAPPTSDDKLNAALEQFTSLASQLGAPTGTPAERFSAKAVPLGARGLADIAFGRETTAAISTLSSLVASGAIKLSPKLQHKLDARLALIGAPQPKIIQVPLSPTQQAALTRLGAAFLPVVRGMQSAGRLDARTAATLRFNPHASIFIQSEDDEAIQLLPPSVRRSVQLALSQGPLANDKQDDAQAQTQSAVRLNDGVESTQMSATGERSETLEPITVPGPEVIAFEQSLSSDLSSLAGADVEMLCQLVMMAIAKDSETELRETLDKMTKINADKKQMREHISAMKKQEATMKSALRQEYDARCALPKGPPGDRIEPSITSFDDFCASQKLNLLAGDLQPGDGGVVPNPAPTFAVSPNKTRYPQASEALQTWGTYTINEQDKAMAARLKIEPHQVMELRRTWESDPKLQTKFTGGFGEWIVRPKSDGGVGLTLNPPASQGTTVAEFLLNNDPAVVTQRLADTFGLSAAQMTTLFQHYTANIPLADRLENGGTFEGWLRGVLDLVDGAGAANLGKMNTYLTSCETDASVQRLSALYGISPGDVQSLQAVFQALSNRPGSFEGFLQSNVGLIQGGPGNNAALDSYLTALGAQLGPTTGAAVDPMDRSYPVPGSRRSMTHEEILRRLTASPTEFVATDFSPDEAKIQQIIDGLIGALPSNVQAGLKEYVGGLVRRMVRAANGSEAPSSTARAWATAQLGSFIHLAADGDMRGLSTLIRRTANDNNDDAQNNDQALYCFSGNLSELADNVGRLTPAQGRDLAAWGELAVAEMLKDADKAMRNGRGETSDGASWSRTDGLQVFFNHDYHQNHLSRSANGQGEWIEGSKWGSIRDDLRRSLDNGETNLRMEEHAAPAPRASAAPPVVVSDADKPAIRAILISREERVRAEGFGLRDPLPTRPTANDLDVLSGFPFVPQGNAPLNTEEAAWLQSMRATLAANCNDGNDFSDKWRGIDRAKYVQLVDRWNRVGVAPAASHSAGTLAALSDEQRAAMAALGAPPQSEIAQPGQVAGLREMSLSQMHAYIEEWEGKKDSLSELSEEVSLKLQMQQDRRAKAFTTLSNMLKKWSDTTGGIIGNFK